MSGSRNTALRWVAAVLFLGVGSPLLFGWPTLGWLLFAGHGLATFVPGLLARRLGGRRIGTDGRTLAFDAAAGITVYCFAYAAAGATLGLWAAAGAAFLISNGAVLLLGRREPGAESGAPIPSGAVLAALVLATLFLILPFRRYGVEVDGYLGFPYLAVSDVFNHVAVVGELAKEIPPQNPYYSGEVLHYYWLSHLVPSSCFRLGGGAISRHTALQMASYFNALLFLGVLCVFLRQRLGGRLEVYLGILLALAAYSYADGLVLVQEIAGRVPEEWRGRLFLDRLLTEGGEVYSGMAHAWVRDFAVEPHAILALFTGTAVWIWLREASGRNGDGPRRFAAGILLAGSFGQDAFVGLAFSGATFLTLAWDIGSAGTSRKRAWSRLGLVAAGFAVGMGVIGALRMPGGGGFVRPAVYWRMLLLSPAVLTSELGPTMILGCIGIVAALRRGRLGKERDLVVLFAVCVVLMFLIRHELAPNIFMRKTLKVIRLPLLALGVLWLGTEMRKPHRVGWWLAFGFLGALSLPTVATDLYRMSRADGGKGSVLVNRADVEACEWLRGHTPLTAVVQSFPDYSWRGSLYTPLVVFGDRRTGLGDWMKAYTYQIGEGRVKERANRIKEVVFGEGSLEETGRVLEELGVDYVYVGPHEIEMAGESARKFGAWGEAFEPVYGERGVTIYRFQATRAR